MYYFLLISLSLIHKYQHDQGNTMEFIQSRSHKQTKFKTWSWNVCAIRAIHAFPKYCWRMQHILVQHLTFITLSLSLIYIIDYTACQVIKFQVYIYYILVLKLPNMSSNNNDHCKVKIFVLMNIWLYIFVCEVQCIG